MRLILIWLARAPPHVQLVYFCQIRKGAQKNFLTFDSKLCIIYFINYQRRYFSLKRQSAQTYKNGQIRHKSD